MFSVRYPPVVPKSTGIFSVIFAKRDAASALTIIWKLNLNPASVGSTLVCCASLKTLTTSSPTYARAVSSTVFPVMFVYSNVTPSRTKESLISRISPLIVIVLLFKVTS